MTETTELNAAIERLELARHNFDFNPPHTHWGLQLVAAREYLHKIWRDRETFCSECRCERCTRELGALPPIDPSAPGGVRHQPAPVPSPPDGREAAK